MHANIVVCDFNFWHALLWCCFAMIKFYSSLLAIDCFNFTLMITFLSHTLVFFHKLFIFVAAVLCISSWVIQAMFDYQVRPELFSCYDFCSMFMFVWQAFEFLEVLLLLKIRRSPQTLSAGWGKQIALFYSPVRISVSETVVLYIDYNH